MIWNASVGVFARRLDLCSAPDGADYYRMQSLCHDFDGFDKTTVWMTIRGIDLAFVARQFRRRRSCLRLRTFEIADDDALCVSRFPLHRTRYVIDGDDFDGDWIDVGMLMESVI